MIIHIQQTILMIQLGIFFNMLKHKQKKTTQKRLKK